jgi:hypothetical protein
MRSRGVADGRRAEQRQALIRCGCNDTALSKSKKIAETGLQPQDVWINSPLLREAMGSGSLRPDWRGPMFGFVFRRMKTPRL